MQASSVSIIQQRDIRSHSINWTYAQTVPAIEEADLEQRQNYIKPTFPIGPFRKFHDNPILMPNPDNRWESAYVYNPAAIVIGKRIWLLYRAQDHRLISSIGLAWSDDGYHFTRFDRPVIVPTEPYEQGGGCEDPRVIYKDHLFYLTYTAYDGLTPRLALATSKNLVDWTKYGPIFETSLDAEYTATGRLVLRAGVSKAGAIFADRHPVTGKHIMLWGEGHLHLAYSDDMINWTNKPFNDFFATGVHAWESRLLEPGPPPIETKDGKYLLVYNCATIGGGKYAYNQYSVAQMLIDLETIEEGPVARVERPTLEVSESQGRGGQVDNVVFCEGLVQFRGKWWMYHGMGDAGIGVATCEAH